MTLDPLCIDRLGLRLMTINSKQKNTGVEQLLQGLDDE